MISRSATLAKKKTGLFYLFVKTSFIFCTTALSILWKICSSDTVISMLYVHGPTVRTLLRGHFESMSRDYASRYITTLQTRFQLPDKTLLHPRKYKNKFTKVRKCRQRHFLQAKSRLSNREFTLCCYRFVSSLCRQYLDGCLTIDRSQKER